MGKVLNLILWFYALLNKIPEEHKKQIIEAFLDIIKKWAGEFFDDIESGNNSGKDDKKNSKSEEGFREKN